MDDHSNYSLRNKNVKIFRRLLYLLQARTLNSQAPTAIPPAAPAPASPM